MTRALALALLATLVLWAAPAHALPGPETVAPIALGVVQVLAFAAAWLASQRHWLRRRRLAWRVAVFVLLLLWNAFAAITFLVVDHALRTRRRWLAIALVALFAAAQLAILRPAPELLEPLPEDLALARPAPPNPRSSEPLLRDGGVIVVHLGEPERFVNCRMEHGYVLRTPDREARTDLAASAVPIVFVDRSDGPGVHRMREPDETICYTPPGALLWKVLTPAFAVGPDAARAPLLLRRGVPRLRDIDGQELAAVQASEVLKTRTRDLPRFRRDDPVVVVADDLDGLSAAANRLAELDVRVVGARLRPGSAPMAIHTLMRAELIGVLALVVATSALVEAIVRHWRMRRVAAAMRSGARLERWVDWLWLLVPCVPAGLCAAAFPHVALAPELWPLASPPMYGPHHWLFPALALAVALAWLWRLRRLAAGPRPWGEALGVAFGAWLVSGGAREAYPNTLQLAALGCGVAGMLVPRWSHASVSDLRAAGHDAGDKAQGLAAAMRATRDVAEGCVVWPGRGDLAATVRRLLAWYGRGRFLLRSSLPGEAHSHGRYRSYEAAPDELEAQLRAVTAAYGDASDAPVLCMPYIGAARSGVAQLDHGGALVELGAGRDAVTSGGRVDGRAHAGRWSGAREGLDDGALLDALLRLEEEPPAVAEWVGPWIVQHGPAPARDDWRSRAWEVMRREGLRPGALERVGEGLRDPAPERVLELWSRCWTRNGPLGQAARWLGVPRALVPRQVVFAIGGGLYAHGPSREALLRLVWLRSRVPGWSAERAFLRVAAACEGGFERLAAASIALRLLQPFLPDVGPEPPLCPSARAIEHASPHRFALELDPSAPAPGGEAEVAAPLGDVHATRAWCAYVRDWIHDRLCRHVAELRGTWAEEETPRCRPPHGTVSLEALEGWAPSAAGARRGDWVHGGGPIVGFVRDTPGDDSVLYLEQPSVDALRGGFAAIVTRYGGRFSHAALVCAQRGHAALFGVGEALAPGERVRLGEDGSVERSEVP